MVRKKRGGGDCVVIVRMPVLSRPFLINIAFALEFYSLVFAASRSLKLIVSAVSIRGNTVYVDETLLIGLKVTSPGMKHSLGGSKIDIQFRVLPKGC